MNEMIAILYQLDRDNKTVVWKGIRSTVALSFLTLVVSCGGGSSSGTPTEPSNDQQNPPSGTAPPNPSKTNLFENDEANGMVGVDESHQFTVSGIATVELISISGDADLTVRGADGYFCESREEVNQNDNCPNDSFSDPLDRNIEYSVTVTGFSDADYRLITNDVTSEQLSFSEQMQRELENPKIERMDIALPSISSSTATISSSSNATVNPGVDRTLQKVVLDVTRDIWPRNSNLRVFFEFDALSRARFNISEYFNNNFSNSNQAICNINMADEVCNDLVSSTVVEWANGWSETSSIRFVVENDPLAADIRVGFMDECLGEDCGSWAQLGRFFQELTVREGNTSINFDWLTEDVVLHEFGHALGLAHEQSHPSFPIEWDLDVAIPYFQRTQGWDRDRVILNVTSRANGPFLSAGIFDPFSIMQYSIIRRDNNRLLITNPEFCPSVSEFWCVEPNAVLSSGDREGIQSIYPTIGTLYGDIELNNSEFITYAPNVDGSTHLLAFNTLDQTLQEDVLTNGAGTIEFTVNFVGRNVDDDCFLFLGSATLEREFYNFTMTLIDNQNQRTVVKELPFSIGGSLDLGCGFESQNAGRFGTVSSISAAITNGLR